MAKRSVATKKTLIDPLFVPPLGSEDEFAYSRDSADDEIIIGNNEYIDEDEFVNDDYDDDDDDDEPSDLPIPENFTIVSQTLRRTASGHQVVDVVIEVEDVPGAINYEIQVVKL